LAHIYSNAMKRIYLSGAQKKKNAKLRKESAIANVPPIMSFFSSSCTSSNLTDISNPPDSSFECPSVTDITSTTIGFTTATATVPMNIPLTEHPFSDTSCQASTDILQQISNESDADYENITKVSKETTVTCFNPIWPNPTDRGHFASEISDELKEIIIKHASCRPLGPFPLNAAKRQFSSDYYSYTNVASVRFEREWLCYSPILDAVYCEPCWLFAPRNGPFFRREWIDGINDWKHIGQKIRKHECTHSHIRSTMVYMHWKKDNRIDKELQDAIRKETNYWMKVLDRLVEIVLTLASCNLSFREHRGESGNFNALVSLVAKYDPILDELLKKAEKSTRYLSPKIQNELIEILSDAVRRAILSDIEKAPFFAVIADSTTDISKKDQLSLVIRYVKFSADMKSALTEESFLGFYDINENHNQTAEGISVLIKEKLQHHGIDLRKCRAQGYDGAAVMSGVYGGVQKRIQDDVPTAAYINCMSHKLNLVVNDAAKCVPEANSMFTTLQALFTFFGSSSRRWTDLALGHMSATVTLKNLCPTRWEARHDAVFATMNRYCDIMKVLTQIVLTSCKADERQEAHNLKKAMESFEFLFLLLMWEKILRTIRAASQALQSPKTDLASAKMLLEKTSTQLTQMRQQFDKIRGNSEELAKKWGVTATFSQRRSRQKKKFPDELAEDVRFLTSEEHFRVSVFLTIVDRAIGQVHWRFQSTKDVFDRFEFLFPKSLMEMTDAQLIRKAECFVQLYGEDLNADFLSQIVCYRETLSDKLRLLDTAGEALDLLLTHNLQTSFPDVVTGYMLLLTFPTTVATAERSFSKLKIIKNYLRSSCGQSRLSGSVDAVLLIAYCIVSLYFSFLLPGLALLSIESSRAKELNRSEIVSKFAYSKARKCNFSV
jgi:hypothetical protein